METINRALLTFVVNALWQVPLFAGAVWAACRSMRNAPARHAHAVCVAGLAMALLLPLASTRRAAPEMTSIAVPQEVVLAPDAPPAAPAAAPAPQSVEVPRGAVSIGFWALAAFLLARILWLAAAGWKTIRLCRSARPAEPCAAFERARAALGLSGIELRWSAEVTSPVTAGRLVILPEAMAGAPEAVLATAIGHEMAHIARHDFAWNLLYELIALPISFHPAAAWLRRRIDRTREMACDELVTARLLDSRSYAQSILDIAASLAAVNRPGYTLGVFDGDVLEERIRRLLRRPAQYSRRTRVLLAAALGTVGVCAVIGAGLAISARAQGPALPELRLGAEAYNAGNFGSAIEHFEKAVALEPDNSKPRLLLVRAYLRLDPRTLKDKAREQAAEAVRRDPADLGATLALASLNGAAGARDSRVLLLRLLQTHTNSKEAYYTLGVLDWMIAYPKLSEAGPHGGAHIYDRIEDPALRAALRNELLPYIEEGQRVLQIAIGLDPQYSDAFAYLNLMGRLRAAVSEDAAEWAKWIAQADEQVGKAIAARKHRAAPPDRIDADGPIPTALPSMVPAPPPPPPPPPGVFRGEGRK